jgi:hypothetical protein
MSEAARLLASASERLVRLVTLPRPADAG